MQALGGMDLQQADVVGPLGARLTFEAALREEILRARSRDRRGRRSRAGGSAGTKSDAGPFFKGMAGPRPWRRAHVLGRGPSTHLKLADLQLLQVRGQGRAEGTGGKGREKKQRGEHARAGRASSQTSRSHGP